MHHFSEPYTRWFLWYTNMQNRSSTKTLFPIFCLVLGVYSAVISIEAVHSDISRANGFDPINIALYGRQVLITIRSDQDIILDSDTTDRFVLVKNIMIDMLRVSYTCQEMR